MEKEYQIANQQYSNMTILVSSNIDLFLRFVDIEEKPFPNTSKKCEIESKMERRIKRRAKQEVRKEQEEE